MPTYISSNSLPAAKKNGTDASPATAFASSVLPVPGGPVSSTPVGVLAPMRLNWAGSCRYFTSSWTSSKLSPKPITSEKRVVMLVSGVY